MFRKILFILLVSPMSLLAQIEFGASVGGTTYGGDLAKTPVIAEETNLAGSVFGRYFLQDQLSIGVGFMAGKISGDDLNKQSSFRRNLNFESNIFEFSVVGAYDFMDIDLDDFTPYVYGGIAVFSHNPTTTIDGQEVELQPLGTEGQGIAGYGEKYDLTQFAIPFGGGLKYRLNDSFLLQADLGARKTFTDHLDDVSRNLYVPYDILVAGNGELAARAAYRADLLPGTPFPAYNTYLSTNENIDQRLASNPRAISDHRDWYYFGSIGAVYRLNISDNPIRKNRRGVPNKYKGRW